MVRFRRISEKGSILLYRYYPEGGEEYGTITVDKDKRSIIILQLAPNDFSYTIPVSELNSLRDSVNAMRIQEGMPELTQKEWPTATAPALSNTYADHAMNRLSKAFETGDWPKEGTVMWY